MQAEKKAERERERERGGESIRERERERERELFGKSPTLEQFGLRGISFHFARQVWESQDIYGFIIIGVYSAPVTVRSCVFV